MTAVVGFVCVDGIVMGADRQVTAPHYTFRERKIFTLNWSSGAGLWSYAGDRDKAVLLKSDIESRIASDTVCDRATIELEWHGSLKCCLKKKKEEFQSLFGCWTEEGPVLWLSNGHELITVPDCEIIGTGDSALSRYLRGTYIEVPGTVNLQQARIYAAHFIKCLEKYDGKYVGGGADVGELSSRGTLIFDAAQTEEWAKQVQELEYRWGLCFRVLANRAFDFDVEMHDALVGAVARFKNWLKGKKEETGL